MIIFLIFLGIAIASFIASFIAFVISKKTCNWYSDSPFVFRVIGIGFMIAVVIMAIIISVEHSPRYKEMKLRECQLRREAIIWQMDNNLYVGGVLDEYNAKIFRAQYQHNNPWTSWFYGDYVLELELISTEETSKRYETEKKH